MGKPLALTKASPATPNASVSDDLSMRDCGGPAAASWEARKRAAGWRGLHHHAMTDRADDRAERLKAPSTCTISRAPLRCMVCVLTCGDKGLLHAAADPGSDDIWGCPQHRMMGAKGKLPAAILSTRERPAAGGPPRPRSPRMSRVFASRDCGPNRHRPVTLACVCLCMLCRGLVAWVCMHWRMGLHESMAEPMLV